MVDMKPTTIFSRTSSISSNESEKNIENKKISYWLEKLYAQRQKLRRFTNRSEDQSRIGVNELPLPDQTPSNNQNLAQSGINEFKKMKLLRKRKISK
jgi:hypothetical protein